MSATNSPYTPVLDRKVFFASIGVVLSASLLVIAFPSASARYAQTAMAFITDKFGRLYLLTGVMPLGFAGWLAFGRFGQIKFGRADEAPEYSTVSWVAMMFTAVTMFAMSAWAQDESENEAGANAAASEVE